MQAEGGDKKTYAWSYDEKAKKMSCCENKTSSCNVSSLWEVTSITEFHDAELQQATIEINGILDGLQRANRDPSRDLHMVEIEGRHLLAWAHSDLVGPDSGDARIAKMLRLKDGTSGKSRKPRSGGGA
jgi:hypothetical protein